MKPPPALIPEKEEDRSPAKTPRPDLSIGIDLEALISALSSQNLNKDKATEFIGLAPEREDTARDRRAAETNAAFDTRPTRLRSRFSVCCYRGQGLLDRQTNLRSREPSCCFRGLRAQYITLSGIAWPIAEEQWTPKPVSYSQSPHKAPSTSSGSTGPSLKVVCSYLNRSFGIVGMDWCRNVQRTFWLSSTAYASGVRGHLCNQWWRV